MTPPLPGNPNDLPSAQSILEIRSATVSIPSQKFSALSIRRFAVFSLLALPVLLCARPAMAQHNDSVAVWLTTPDRASLLAQQPQPLQFQKTESTLPAIDVDDSRKFQTMDGFGLALTGGSAQLIMQMSAPRRAALLHELFGRENGDIGISFLRISLGSSDMNDHPFTYDDLPPGETDPYLTKFSLGPDQTTVVPVLQKILAINPQIPILATPWSAPAWMKTNGSLKGGSLKPEYYDAYARYLDIYVHAMKANGIFIYAVAPQNEPLNPDNTPSLVMQASEEDQFIRQSLGPDLRLRAIKYEILVSPRIIIYDHNCDRPDYPLTILADPEARKYVDGSAFHLYAGDISALTKVHDAYPDKNIYFTEQMVVDDPDDPQHLKIASPVKDLVIGAPRNWARNVLLWNLAADPKFGPHTNDGGCPVCEGAITLDGDRVTRNAAYYTIAHASKFVPPGSVRIASTASDTVPNVAFLTPQGYTVLIAANTGTSPQQFQIRWRGKSAPATLSAGAVATFVWK
jgi:glucosylceramidase